MTGRLTTAAAAAVAAVAVAVVLAAEEAVAAGAKVGPAGAGCLAPVADADDDKGGDWAL